MTTPEQESQDWKHLDEHLPSVVHSVSPKAPIRVKFSQPQSVSVAGVDMPFKSMVILLLKWELAAILAALIIASALGIVYGILAVLFEAQINSR
jgi:hypothetical protein